MVSPAGHTVGRASNAKSRLVSSGGSQNPGFASKKVGLMMKDTDTLPSTACRPFMCQRSACNRYTCYVHITRETSNEWKELSNLIKTIKGPFKLEQLKSVEMVELRGNCLRARRLLRRATEGRSQDAQAEKDSWNVFVLAGEPESQRLRSHPTEGLD
ncbi:hypothetical protein LX36DRAFT_325767 [Colletotrichum falcatum]|nr:hypothetical protein LX36DRAFT_325767 [Colletotrichum falcatum]